jgi:HAD superfamily hydrolase (TIGR01509 family)
VHQTGDVEAALLDWRGTLVADFPDSWWLERAHHVLGRRLLPDEIDQMAASLERAAMEADIERGFLTEDCSAELHREHNLKWFERAGLDEDLATALYELDFDSAHHPFYLDVPFFLEGLRERGAAVAVVSDIHFDLRPEFKKAGLDRCVDAFVLSFEHGVQKPDQEMFQLALDQLGIDPREAVMFGDRASRDGGAASIGVATVILPPLLSVGERGLRAFLSLWDGD